jgi:hypothetical protein
MRLSGTNEVYVVVGLAVLSVLAPKLIKPLTGGLVGRAVSTAIAAYLALYVSLPVALFWTIAVHASLCHCGGGGGMEYMCSPTMATKEMCESTTNGGKWDEATKKCKCGGM